MKSPARAHITNDRASNAMFKMAPHRKNARSVAMSMVNSFASEVESERRGRPRRPSPPMYRETTMRGGVRLVALPLAPPIYLIQKSLEMSSSSSNGIWASAGAGAFAFLGAGA